MKKITLVLFTLLTLLPLGAWAEETVEGIIYSLNGSNATVTGFTDETKTSEKSIIIPNSITIGEDSGISYDVTAIADDAFSGYTDVESISIGEHVTSMGNNTLANCKELLTLTIKNSSLFESLSINFAQTQIPSGLTIVYKGLRYKHYGEWSGTNNYFAVGNGNNGKGYDQPTADGNLVVLEKICDINVTTIANNAFYGVGDSKTIQLPASITTISNTSFVNNKLSAFSIADANPNFSVIVGVLFSKDEKELISFPTQMGITYTIPNGVTTIGKDAFNNHQSLTNITIPASVEIIEQSAFQYVGKNSGFSITFDSGSELTTIGKNAFFESGLSSITLPNKVKTIGDQAYQNCTELTSINLPASLTSIGGNAFSECNQLATLTFADSYEGLTIGSGAFYNCKLVKDLYLKEGITTIGSGAFSRDEEGSTSQLKNLYLPTTATFTDANAIAYASTHIYRKISIDFGTGNSWATYYSSMNLALPVDDSSNKILKAYTITGVSGTSIETQELSYIHANKPILLERSGNTSLPEYYQIPKNSTIEVDKDIVFKEYLVGTPNGISNISSIPGDKYVLDGDKFVKTHQGSLPPFRCYLILNNGTDAQPSTIYLKDTGNNTFIHLEEGNRVNYTLGTASLLNADEKMKLRRTQIFPWHTTHSPA